MAKAFTVDKLRTGYGLGSPAPSYVVPSNNVGVVGVGVGPAAAASKLASEANDARGLIAPRAPRAPHPGIRRIRVRRPRTSPRGAFSLPPANPNY